MSDYSKHIIFHDIFVQDITKVSLSIISFHKSICVLAQTFCMNSPADFKELQSMLEYLPASRNPLRLVDTKKYYPHLYQNNGILNIDTKDIFQFEIDGFEKKKIDGIDNIQEKIFCLDDEGNCEVNFSSIKWIFILDRKYQLGLLFYVIDLKTRSHDCLESLSKTKIFRYFKEPGNDSIYKLKVFENGKGIGYLSFYSIFRDCFGSLCDKMKFLEAKPLQFHFLDKMSYHIPANRESNCYNLLRIPADSNVEVEKKYFSQNTGHVYENSSIYAFSMTEGIVLTSPYKTPKELFSNFLATQIVFLFHRRFEHIVSGFMEKHSLSNSKITKSFIKGLKQIRKDMNLSNYYVGVPISQYSEIQEVYNLTKLNSGLNYAEVKEAFNDAAILLMEESEEINNEREKKIGLILGVLGITGFISFIFEYLLISKHQKFIDTLDFPFNTLPFFLFLIIFVIVWRFLHKN